jgi:hypothetical protein
MISAKEANFESKNRARINEIETCLDDAIQEAVKKGKFRASCTINSGLSQEIREKLKEEIENLGYEISITDVDKEYEGAPYEQRPWYDNIYVSWGEK